MLSIVCCLLLVSQCLAFQCYTCNNRPDEDDTQPCRTRIEECPTGIQSCSSVAFRDLQDRMHYRKFCTAPGTALYYYLTNFPGSSLCQNIEMSAAKPSTPARTKREDTTAPEAPSSQTDIGGAPSSQPMPPSPPNMTYVSTLLCVCTKSTCNEGTITDVMTNVLMQNIRDGQPKVKEGVKTNV